MHLPCLSLTLHGVTSSSLQPVLWRWSVRRRLGGPLWPHSRPMRTRSPAARRSNWLSLRLRRQIVEVFWRGRLIFVRHRTEKEIREAREAPLSALVDPEADEARTKDGSRSGWRCTATGPRLRSTRPPGALRDGWYCGSLFDTSGRVRRGPAPISLPIPPYAFVSEAKIRIGGETA